MVEDKTFAIPERITALLEILQNTAFELVDFLEAVRLKEELPWRIECRRCRMSPSVRSFVLRELERLPRGTHERFRGLDARHS